MATKVKIRKCHICGIRPASTEQGFCHNCQSQLDADRRRKRKPLADYYVTYQGITVALYSYDGDKFKPEYTKCDPDKIPKQRLINLNKYCIGYERKQVKKLKRLCLRFAK